MLARQGCDNAGAVAQAVLTARYAEQSTTPTAAEVVEHNLCEICFLAFCSVEQRAPRRRRATSPGGHTFCESRLDDMVRTAKDEGKIHYPSCRLEVAVPKGDASQLPKNFIAER